MFEGKNTMLRIIAVAIFIIAVSAGMQSQDLKKIVDLRGNWKFSIGDNPGWASPDYDDNHWETIRVPKNWEEQGFHGYDGYGWYRTTFKIPKTSQKLNYYLQLGYVDDVDAVYINGKKIGQTGSFPPHYSTAYNASRLYMIPSKLIRESEEITLAVRVFDEGGEGGIVHGNIEILVDFSSVYADVDLQGDWKFKTGDCSGLPDKMEYDTWQDIYVPGPWENQGYKNYDGIACYVTEFDLENKFPDQRMVLLLGRIDDLDMVYLNGVLIGQSGDFEEETVHQRSDMYKVSRGYYIPPEVLNHNGNNVLVVKVLDYTGLGGIWDGTIGLITQDNYIEFWRRKRNSKQY